jgi:hypothetical protein
MSAADVWDIRFPDGRGLRAIDTDTLSNYIRAGKVPQGTLARRDGEQDWVALDWVPEFAAPLAERARRNAHQTPMPEKSSPTRSRSTRAVGDQLVSARLETAALGTLGVPTILREVITALDLTLLSRKLWLLLILGLLGGLLFALPPWLGEAPSWLGWAQGGVALLLLSYGAAAIAQTVYVELSRNRPASGREARHGRLLTTGRLFFGFLILPGVGVAVLAGLVWLSGWLATQGASAASPLRWDVSSTVAAGLAILVALKLLVLAPVFLMLAPVLVVEECGLFRAIGQWTQILRENLGRVLLYQILAVALTLALLAVPAGLAYCLTYLPLEPRHAALVAVTQGVIQGILAALGIGFLVVVQVFLYLNLRFLVSR